MALVGYMHRDLVEKSNWISEEEYREGLALAQLAPGPFAAQMAIYLGLCTLWDPRCYPSRSDSCSSVIFNGTGFRLTLCPFLEVCSGCSRLVLIQPCCKTACFCITLIFSISESL